MRTEGASVPLLVRIGYQRSPGSQAGRKGQHSASGWELFFPINSRSLECSISLTGYGDSGDDAGGGKSDVRCTYKLGERNNMNTDSRHTDNSGRTGARSTRRDNN